MKIRANQSLTIGRKAGKRGDPSKGVPPKAPDVTEVAAGTVFDSPFTEKETAALIARGVVSPVGEAVSAGPSDPKERAAMLDNAIGVLVTEADAAAFIKSGAPRIAVLESALGWNVDEDDRDDAWAVFQGAHADLFSK